MNRRDFFRQLTSDFRETVREFAGPFIEKDLEKLETLADAFSGYTYYRLEGEPESRAADVRQPPFSEKRVGNEPVLLYREPVHSSGETGAGGRPENPVHAYSGKCPACGQLLQVLPHKRAFRCFACEAEIAFEKRERLIAFPLKRKEGNLYIGIPRREGNGHA